MLYACAVFADDKENNKKYNVLFIIIGGIEKENLSGTRKYQPVEKKLGALLETYRNKKIGSRTTFAQNYKA